MIDLGLWRNWRISSYERNQSQFRSISLCIENISRGHEWSKEKRRLTFTAYFGLDNK